MEYRTKNGLPPNPKTVYACKIQAVRGHPAEYKESFARGEEISPERSCTKDGACSETGASQGPDRHDYYDTNRNDREFAFNLCMVSEGHALTEVEDKVDLYEIFLKPEKELIPMDLLLHPVTPNQIHESDK